MSEPEQPYSLATHADPRVIWAELTELRGIVGELAERPYYQSGCVCKNYVYDHKTGGVKMDHHNPDCLWLRSQKWRKG